MDFVFTQYFGIEYELTENPDIITLPDTVYISYSTQKVANNFYTVFQDNLLLEQDIKTPSIFVSREASMPVFFQTTDDYDLKFDLFSCIFYLLSRYEEYLPHDKDEHGRYKSSNSILAKKEFNFAPVIETWLIFFKEALLKINSQLFFKKYEFEYIPTFDIDNAYRYLGRNWKKHLPNVLNSGYWKTVTGLQKDPYDIFDKLLIETEIDKLKPIFFFLLNDDGENNSKVSPHANQLRALINKAGRAQIGIHPSYLSFESHLIQQEKKLLENISSKSITCSRQHFLKINFPNYYRSLAESGIQTDYSLSYPDVIGFRAGCSRPFKFFDIEKNEETALYIQPSCWMDATYAYYQTINIDEIQYNFLTLFNQLKKINGILVPIFHNDLLAMDKYWGIFGFINQQVILGDEK